MKKWLNDLRHVRTILFMFNQVLYLTFLIAELSVASTIQVIILPSDDAFGVFVFNSNLSTIYIDEPRNGNVEFLSFEVGIYRDIFKRKNFNLVFFLL